MWKTAQISANSLWNANKWVLCDSSGRLVTKGGRKSSTRLPVHHFTSTCHKLSVQCETVSH